MSCPMQAIKIRKKNPLLWTSLNLRPATRAAWNGVQCGGIRKANHWLWRQKWTTDIAHAPNLTSKESRIFFAWMWSNTADAIMFVTWCHTTQLEGVNFYYVKGQLTRRLDVWSKLIENDWLKKDEQAPAGNQLTIGHFIYHLLYWSKCSLPRMQGQELWESVAVQAGRTKRDTWDDTWRNCGRVSEYRF